MDSWSACFLKTQDRLAGKARVNGNTAGNGSDYRVLRLATLQRAFFIVSLFVTSVAYATPSIMESEINRLFGATPNAPFDNSVGNCGGCHSKVVNSGLRLSADQVPFGSSTTSASLVGINRSSYSWYYRVNGGSVNRIQEGGTNGLSLPLGSSTANSFNIDYCVGQGTAGNGSEAKQFNCSSLAVTRQDPPNTFPMITSSPIPDRTVDLIGGEFDVSITADDTDLDTLTYSSSVIGDPSIEVSGGDASGNFTITPIAAGTATVTLSVSDGRGGTDSDAFNVTVENAPPVNNAPRITSNQADITLSINDDPVSIIVTAVDDEGDSLEYSASFSPEVTVTGGGPTGSFLISPEAIGIATVTWIVSDSMEQVTQSFTVNVVEGGTEPDNTPPVVQPVSTVVIDLTVGEEFDFTLEATDVDDSTLSFTAISDDPSVIEVEFEEPDTPTISTPGQPIRGDFEVDAVGVGTTTVRFLVTDNKSPPVSVSLTFSVSRGAGDTPPTITAVEPSGPLVLSISEQQTLTLTADDDNVETLSYQGTSDNSSVATVSHINNGVFTVNGERMGSAQLTLTVVDSESQSASINITVQVNADNRAPTAVADSIVVADSQVSVLLNITDNDSDPDNDPFSIQLIETQSALGGSLVVVDDAVRYTPPEDFTSEDSFEYAVVDTGNLVSNIVVVTLRPSDRDGDNIFDSVDNCVLLPNEDQMDMDSDELGDVCDPDPDGDGIPGLPGQPLPSGRDLVEAECLTCHNNPIIGAPQFNDEAAWAVLIARGNDVLIDSTINGLGDDGRMPAFGDRYSATELTAAVLYLSGQEGGTGDDQDLDTIADAADNCPRVPNTDQQDSDNDMIGDVCEPLADKDADGYVFSIDDDDGNAMRLPGRLGQANGSAGIFFGSNPMSLGSIASNEAEFNNHSSAGVVMSSAAFLAAANRLYPETQHEIDNTVTVSPGVFDIVLATAGSPMADVRISLSTSLPLQPVLRTYDTDSGSWMNFSTANNDAIRSAPSDSAECPAVDSPNFSAGLQAGLGCVLLQVVDGGVNDADGQANGEVQLILLLGRQSTMDDGGSPPIVDVNGEKGGGGRIDGWLLFVLLTAIFPKLTNNYRTRPQMEGY